RAKVEPRAVMAKKRSTALPGGAAAPGGPAEIPEFAERIRIDIQNAASGIPKAASRLFPWLIASFVYAFQPGYSRFALR
ncbi:hypothetical protein ACWEQB_35570, partial [Streptomyces cyaneofuscatus]